MMLIGHSIAQRVHLMHRSSSRRNMPRKRSEGSFFSSAYWIVVFFVTRWRPVTPRPSKRSRSDSLSSQLLRLTRSPRLRRGEPAPQPGEPEEQEEERSEER